MQNTERRSTNIVEEKDGEGEEKERSGGDGSDKTMKVPMGQGKDGANGRGDYCTKMQIQSDGNATRCNGGREGKV